MSTDTELLVKLTKLLSGLDELKKGDKADLSFFGSTENGETYFLKKDGNRPLQRLLEKWWRDSEFQKLSTFKEYYLVVAHEVLKRIYRIPESSLAPPFSSNLKDEIHKRLSTRLVTVTHFEGCHIIPYKADAFAIGPVRFSTLEDFKNKDDHQEDKFNLKKDFVKLMEKNGVLWVAEVQIVNALSGRGEELAAFAIDIALSSLQLVFPPSEAKGMRRYYALNFPHWVINLQKNGKNWGVGRTNQIPGNAYSGSYFTQEILKRSDILSSYGRRIDGFTAQSHETLNDAWCDAMYWFHEGIAEPLDTIAVTKLETCLEVLLGAESTKGSTAKITEILKIFTSKEEYDKVYPDSDLTLKQLAVSLVEDRSRILHGTLSTFRHDARESRAVLTYVAGVMLGEISKRMDEFKISGSYVDEHKVFLDWMIGWYKSRRQSTSPQQNTNT